ncbi:general transcription factor II-I repeat domain-containing protein 2-like [Tachypleus tridentatus]|uniref:general transcription factor II-I repeat domain-containing protein 2-like n=1 Tax=Tachypleus tridentatus TaxID=6853 RepID=UPI003FD5FFE7
MAERGKPFTDGNFIKECMMEAANELCPEKANFFESISFSATSFVQRAEELGENIALQIRQKARNFIWYSLVLDESTDLSSTSQLLVFIRGVNLDFQITEELASVCSMHGRTTGEDIFMEVHKTLRDYNHQWNQLRGVTVDGGKKYGWSKEGSGGADQEIVGRSATPKRSVHTLHHTSASTLWKRLRYFLRTETSHFCCELHSGSCT